MRRSVRKNLDLQDLIRQAIYELENLTLPPLSDLFVEHTYVEMAGLSKKLRDLEVRLQALQDGCNHSWVLTARRLTVEIYQCEICNAKKTEV